MRNLLAILLSTLTLLSTYGAANGIDGELLVKVGTTGNKALPTSQTTNVTISATSRVTDGASAVAFSLNSSNYITDGAALLLAIQNHGTNHLTLDPDGGFKVSGESATSFIQTYDRSNPNNYFYADNEPLIALGFGGTERTILNPIIADGTTPYTFDTSLAHTSGHLMEVKNNGTNYFNFEADQASTNTPITININGTLKRVHVGAPDSGGTGLRALTVVN